MNPELEHPEVEDLVATVLGFGRRNWVPATSSNFSLQLQASEGFWISRSGVDKNRFSREDLIRVDFEGQPTRPGDKPSAETLIHCLIYEEFPKTRAVLHTHGIYSTLISMACEDAESVTFSGLELLKVYPGVDTHDTTVTLPIFRNSQDMHGFCDAIRGEIQALAGHQVFLIAGHGLYAWGESVAEARRLVEGTEFLLEYHYLRSSRPN